MKRAQRQRLIVAAIAAAIILTLLLAPSRSRLNAGSTYSRAPDGYGAWYAFMERRDTPVRRWQKPLEALKNREPIALLRVLTAVEPSNLDASTLAWLRRGNTLVVLGGWQPVTEAPFSSSLESARGTVKIETRRRSLERAVQIVHLRDRFGAVVWEQAYGTGRLIGATTPHLAANAYQNEPGNYEFLAQLLAERSQPIWVDEYLHGYRDAQGAEGEEQKPLNLWQYLARTPLLPVAIQGAIVLLVAIAAQNRRFGRPQALNAPEVNNSQAYIAALASVLNKAQSSEFVVETLTKAEQLALQERLGLGTTPLELEALSQAWQERTGREPTVLRRLLARRPRSRSDRELVNGLEQWRALDRDF